MNSSTELYYKPGTLSDTDVTWGATPSVSLDMEFHHMQVSVYFRLLLQALQAGIEINSVYASSFRQQFAADVAGRDAASAGRMEKLIGALEAVDAPERRDIYLLIAREALIRGKFELAKLAGDKAVHLAEEASAEWRRASLYAAAAFVAGGDMETGMSTLEAMDKAGLEEEDAELLEAARSVAAEVRRLPAASQASADGPPAGAVEAARQSMARVDQLIEAVSK